MSMNGFITKTVAALCLAGGLVCSPGCKSLRDLYDPCWPERYSFAARREVCQSFAPQVRNGHILEQTIFNYHFEAGEDVLTPGGQDRLLYLIRRRPCPSPVVYLATAQDISYDPEAPEKFVETRYDLDARRIAAVQKYLTAQTAGRHLNFQVCVHDPYEVGWDAESVNNAVLRMHNTFQGGLPGGVSPGGGGLGVTQ
jgi:hypothetical protein